MKVVALISGGKDSCYNMIECVRNGHEIVALANLKPNIEGEIDSWMYQSVAQVSFIATFMNSFFYISTINFYNTIVFITFLRSVH